MAFVQGPRIKEILITLQLVLLPLSLQHAAPCPIFDQEMVVATTSEAEILAEALQCDGPGVFTVNWNGDVMISRTISVSNGSTLDVTGSSSESSNGAVIGDGTVLLFEVDLGSTLLLTGLTFSGGNGALLVAGKSIVEMVDCSFMSNNKTSQSSYGGALFVTGSNVVFKGETVFANNTAEYGGAICVNDQGVFNSYGTALFVSNEAEFGGAMIFDDSEGNFISNVSFERNHATASGGALFADDYTTISFGGEIVFASNTAAHGGALYADDYTTISFGGEIVFANNTAAYGGALYADDYTTISFGGEIVFANNTAAYGGALFAYDYTTISFGGEIVFANNTAAYGGAICLDDGSELNVMEGANVSFLDNHAENTGGAIRVNDQGVFNSYGTALFVSNEAEFGGAIHLDNGSELNVMEGGNTYLYNNHANSLGGAIRVKGQGVFNSYGNALFVSNQAGFGGAVYVEISSVSFGGETLFTNNTAENGGAIYSSSDSKLFVGTGTRFISNVATNGSGGGVYASESVMFLNGAVFTENNGVRGGGVASISSDSNIIGCIFNGNTATDGGAIYTSAGNDIVVNSSFTRNFAAGLGGALLHSGVLVALTGCTFESNMAGEDGLAVITLGTVGVMTASSFRNNFIFCASGMYSLAEESDVFEQDSDTCRWGVVCSRCTDQCNAPVGIDMDETTVPVCVVVPEGVNTTEDPGMTLETLSLLSGFYRTSNKSRAVLECHREEACMGGSTAGHYCAEGYGGPYCAACDEGYVSGFQYSCHSCQGSHRWTAIGEAIAFLIVVVPVVVIVVVITVSFLVGVIDRPTSERIGTWERRVSNFRNGLVRVIPLTATKIVVVTWQIITQFSGVVNVQYPLAYEKFLAALSVVHLNLGSILSQSCVMETNFYVRLMLATIAPMAVLGALAITYRVSMVRNGHSIHAMRVARNRHISVGLFLLFVVYSSVSYTIFQTFVCDSLGSGVSYLRVDYNLVCWTRTHIGYVTYAGVMVLVYPVGIPAVFACVLFINRDGIKSIEDTTNGSRVTPESEAIKDLWAPYKPSRYYYEVIECGRRIALTGLVVFIFPGSTAQVAIEALLAFVFSTLSEMMSPFAKPLDAWLYRFGTWVIFLSMYLALLLKMDTADEDSQSQEVFAGLLIAAHGGMVSAVIANALLSALKGFREVRAVEMPSR